VAPVGETRNAYRLLVGKPEGKRRLGRGVDSSDSGQGRVACCCECGDKFGFAYLRVTSWPAEQLLATHN